MHWVFEHINATLLYNSCVKWSVERYYTDTQKIDG